MIREAEEFAEEDKLAKERIDARNAFDGYIHSMKSAIEGSGDNKGLGEKMDEDEKETIDDAIKDGQDWLSSNPEASGRRWMRTRRRPSMTPSRMGRIGCRATRRPTRRRSRASAPRLSRSITRAAAGARQTTMRMTMTRRTTSSELETKVLATLPAKQVHYSTQAA